MRHTTTQRNVWRRREPCRGFSLIELTIVIALIAILGALAAPRFASASARQRAIAAANRIEADLALAQQHARASSDDYTVQFNGDNTYKRISADGSADQTIDLAAEPYGVTLAVTLERGGTDLVFNGYGLPDGGATITITGGDKAIVLTLDSTTGEVTRQ